MRSDEVYDQYRTGWLDAADLHFICGWLDLPPGCNVLDAACGAGRPTVWIARTMGWEILGIDQRGDLIDLADRYASAHRTSHLTSFVCADLEETRTLETASLDAVLFLDSILQFDDRELRSHFLTWHDKLKPSGKIVVIDPVVLTGQVSEKEKAERQIIVEKPLRFADLEGNISLFEECGFSVIDHFDCSSSALSYVQTFFDTQPDTPADPEWARFRRAYQVTKDTLSQHRMQRIAFLLQKI